MKVPFRQQSSDYDCVPTTFLNALSYLFNRGEVPPYIVNRVYKDCMDLEYSRGTSSRAIQELGYLLNSYRDMSYLRFVAEAKYLCGKQVHFGQNSKIIHCLNAHGTVLLCVHSSRGNWHYILALRYENGWLHCYDPSPRTKRFIDNDAVQFEMTSTHQEPNLRIRVDWLERRLEKTQHAHERKYVLGNYDDRECVLLNRISV